MEIHNRLTFQDGCHGLLTLENNKIRYNSFSFTDNEPIFGEIVAENHPHNILRGLTYYSVVLAHNIGGNMHSIKGCYIFY